MADQQAQTAAAEDAPAPGLGTASVAPATILQDLEPLPEDGGDLEAVSSPKAVLKISFWQLLTL